MIFAREDSIYRFDEFALDSGKRVLRRDDQPVLLNPKAFDLLVVLVEEHGKIVSKEALLEKVWPGQFVEEGNLTVHISTLRKLFGERRGLRRYIMTIPGRGYKFVGDVTVWGRGITVEEHTFTEVEIEEETTTDEASAAPFILPVIVRDGATEAPTALNSSDSFGRYRFGMIAVAVTVSILLVSGLGYFFLTRWKERGAITPSQTGFNERSSRQLTAFGNVDKAAISPDGKYFVFDLFFPDGNESLWVGNVSGGKPLQIRPPERANFRMLAFSSDSNYVLFSVRTDKDPGGGLFRIPVLGGPTQRLLDPIPTPFSISQDGSEIAFVRNDSINGRSSLIVKKIGGETIEREISSRPLTVRFTGQPGWSPDGGSLAVGAASPDYPNKVALVRVSVRDGKVERFDSQVWDQISGIAWLHDDSGIVFHAIGPNSNFHIWELDLPGQTLRRLTSDLSRYGRGSLSIANDGNSLLVVRDEIDANIWTGPAVDTSQLKQTTNQSLGNLAGSAGLDWTPEGSVVYSLFSNNSNSLWISQIDGSDARQITSEGSSDTFPSVSHDGRYIVFQSNRNGGEEIWRVNVDGGDLRQLVSSGGRAFHPAITPDGKWVLYAAMDDAGPSIWRVSIDGGEPMRLTGRGVNLPTISPDGKFFAASFSSGPDSEADQIAVFLIDGGSPIRRFAAAKRATLGNCLGWSPDGGSIVYRDSFAGLWVQKLTGGDPEKMADLPQKRIYYFDWTNDGKSLGISFGDEIRDVQLISNFNPERNAE